MVAIWIVCRLKHSHPCCYGDDLGDDGFPWYNIHNETLLIGCFALIVSSSQCQFITGTDSKQISLHDYDQDASSVFFFFFWNQHFSLSEIVFHFCFFSMTVLCKFSIENSHIVIITWHPLWSMRLGRKVYYSFFSAENLPIFFSFLWPSFGHGVCVLVSYTDTDWLVPIFSPFWNKVGVVFGNYFCVTTSHQTLRAQFEPEKRRRRKYIRLKHSFWLMLVEVRFR